MAVCKKCGAHIEEDLKFCDKCGSEMTVTESKKDIETEIEFETISDVEEKVAKKTSVGMIGQIENVVHSFLPHPFTKKGDRTSLLIGIGSLAVLAVTYLVCFFTFMSDICLPVGVEDLGAEGASELWVIAHFVFNLFTACFVVKAFLEKKYRFYAVFVSAGIFVITVFALIFWGMCEPKDYAEALVMYEESMGSVAWFSFVDCLSEAWYLKLILSLSAIFGFGVDYIVNEGK